MLNIALDWDGTYTADPSFFGQVAEMAKRSGHKIYIVTMRYPSEGRDLIPMAWRVDGIVYTSRQSKRAACEALGLEIDIWMDDHPIAVEKDAIQIWNKPTPQNTIIATSQITGKLEEMQVDPIDPWSYSHAEKVFLASEIFPPVGYWVHFKRKEDGPWELGYTRLIYKNYRSVAVLSTVADRAAEVYLEDHLHDESHKLGYLHSWMVLSNPRKP